MIAINDILELHDRSIELYGGSTGIRDQGLLGSALARPFQTFGGEDLYPDIWSKAAALGESLIINHPFIDGNKRTGIIAVAAFLLEHRFTLSVNNETLYNFTIAISTGEMKFEQITEWLKLNSTVL